jgi:secreted PhoX family phosphatase
MLTRRSLLATAAIMPLARPLVAQTLDDALAPHVHRSTVMLWGDRVEPDSPTFAPDALTAHAAATQFGWDALVVGVMPAVQGEDGVARAILVVAHPAPMTRMLPPGTPPGVLAGMQGVSVLNLELHNGKWLFTDGGFQTRRLTNETLCRISGPAGSSLGDGTRGIIDPSSGTLTPWRRALIGETPNGPAAGFVVEIDPADPEAIPVKRTAMGRFARAGMLATVARDGRPVVWMSEAGAQGRLYRFTASAPISPDNPNALDQGALEVGVIENDVLRFIKAEDTASASGLDAPAGMVMQADGTILLACRGASGTGAANALGSGNPQGRILLLRPQGGDVSAAAFSLELALIGGNTGTGAAIVSHPSCLAIGPGGHVWIGADSSGVALAERNFTQVTQLYRQPVGALIGGLAFTPDMALCLAAVRHPGATPAANWANPATRWPTLRQDMPPQSVIVGLSLA